MATSTKPSEPRSVKAADLAAPKFFPSAKAAPQPIPKPAVIEENDGEEGVNLEAEVNPQDEYEYTGKSSTQIEDDVKDLFKGTVVNHEVEIEDKEYVVPKFIDDFRLLPHQVQARQWMEQRETGGSRGGILADDMGSVLLVTVLIWKLKSVPDLAKPFRPSSVSSWESLTQVTKGKVTSRQPCRSRLVPVFRGLTTESVWSPPRRWRLSGRRKSKDLSLRCVSFSIPGLVAPEVRGVLTLPRWPLT